MKEAASLLRFVRDMPGDIVTVPKEYDDNDDLREEFDESLQDLIACLEHAKEFPT